MRGDSRGRFVCRHRTLSHRLCRASVVSIGAVAVFFFATAAAADSSADETAIRTQLDRWRALWSQTGRGEVFSLDGYEGLFVDGPSMLTFDSYVPPWATTQIDGFADYKAIWEADVNASFPGWKIEKMEVLRVEVAAYGDLAWSALNFWGSGTRPDGTRYEGSQHGTHVWRKVDGTWRIQHEHLTSPIRVHGAANARIRGRQDTRPRLEEAPGTQ